MMDGAFNLNHLACVSLLRHYTKDHMNAYFKRVEGLTKCMVISSRHRFMCQDLIEMRKMGWRERRKQEGPKKIEEVHRDAVRRRRCSFKPLV